MWLSGLGALDICILPSDCIKGVSLNPIEGEQKKLSSQKSNSNTVGFTFQTYKYAYIVEKYIIYLYNL